MNLLDIANRAERAEDPDREMFIAAWVDCFAPGGSMVIRDWPGGLCAKWIKFMRLVDEEGWVNAAMMFVPDEFHDDWSLYPAPQVGRRWEGCVGDFATNALDPALALFAAALRKRAEMAS